MRKIKKAILCFTVILSMFSIFAFTACGSEAELVNVLIQYPANKLDYVVGETFDSTGMVVVGVYSDKSTKIINDYTIDKTGELTADDTEITLSYGGFSVKQAITCIPANEKVILDFTALGSRARVGCYADLSVKMTFGELTGDAVETGTWTYKDGVLTLTFGESKFNEAVVVPTLNLQGGYTFDRNVVLMGGAYNMGGKTFVIDADAWKPVLEGKTWE